MCTLCLPAARVKKSPFESWKACNRYVPENLFSSISLVSDIPWTLKWNWFNSTDGTITTSFKNHKTISNSREQADKLPTLPTQPDSKGCCGPFWSPRCDHLFCNRRPLSLMNLLFSLNWNWAFWGITRFQPFHLHYYHLRGTLHIWSPPCESKSETKHFHSLLKWAASCRGSLSAPHWGHF